MRGDQSFVLAEVSLMGPLNLHGKVSGRQLDTQVWLSGKRMWLEMTAFGISRDKTLFILIGPFSNPTRRVYLCPF